MLRMTTMITTRRNLCVGFAAATLVFAIGLQANGQCEPLNNGDFENGLAKWKTDPQNTQTGQASASSNANVVDSSVIGPPMSGQAAVLTTSAYALGGQPGVTNQSLASITLITQTEVNSRFLVFDGFGSWEMLRAGAGTGTYEFRAEIEDAQGDIAARTFAILNSPPPMQCGMAMSILGVVAPPQRNGPFALDALFNGQMPSGISLGDEVTLRLRLECSAGAVTAGCDETEFGIAVFVDNFRFCALPIGCPDFSGDGQVGVDDMLAVIAGWGACPASPQPCPVDTNLDGLVDVNDLLAVITNWGPCSS
jgi:hypothetical protein